MASSGVALDALAEDAGVPSGEAKIVEAGLEIQVWLDEVVAGVKGTLRQREDAAVVGFLEDYLPLLRADGALVLGALLAARRIGRFPGRTKDHRVGSLLATGEAEIVLWLPVVVATEPAKVALVGLRDRDRHVVVEVIAYEKTEVGLEKDARPVLVNLDPSPAQDGREVVEYGVHLGPRERNPPVSLKDATRRRLWR